MSEKKKVTRKKSTNKEFKAESNESVNHSQMEDTMEKTLKIDAHKLQLLSDRIAQTIEALNLVRYSAMNQSYVQPGLGQWNVLGQNPYYAQSVLPTFAQPALYDRNIVDQRFFDGRTLDGRFVAPNHTFGYNYNSIPFTGMNTAFGYNSLPFGGQPFYGFNQPVNMPVAQPINMAVPFHGNGVTSAFGYNFNGLTPVVPAFGTQFGGINPIAHSWSQSLYNNPQGYTYGQPEMMGRTAMANHAANHAYNTATPAI